MISKQSDSICHHTQINIDLLVIKEMCYDNSYMILTLLELFRNYTSEKKVSLEYSWMEKEILLHVKSFDKPAIDDFKNRLPNYLEYTFKDFLTPPILDIISIHSKQRIKYEDAPDVKEYFKNGMNSCRLEQDLIPKQSLGKKPKI